MWIDTRLLKYETQPVALQNKNILNKTNNEQCAHKKFGREGNP